MEPVSHRNGAAASPTAARTTRRALGAGAAARARVLRVSLQGVITSRRILRVPSEAETECLGGLLTSETLAWARQNPRPNPTGGASACAFATLREAFGWVPPRAERATGTAHDRPRIGTKRVPRTSESVPRSRLRGASPSAANAAGTRESHFGGRHRTSRSRVRCLEGGAPFWALKARYATS